jgi:SNF2 family DNA or RNA helicase
MIPQVRKILVVSSKTAILSTWPDEMRKHTNFRYVHLVGNARQKLACLQLGLRKSYTPETAYSGAVTTPVVFLINFEGIRSIYDYLVQANFSMIIVDESTKIKSPKAQRSKVLWALGRTVNHRWIMTGFPITENLMEIFSQIKFLDFGEALGPKYYPFLEKYFYRAGFKRKPKKGTEKKIFKKIKPFAIRVSNDVLGLPPKVYQERKVSPTKQQRELLSQLNDYFRLEFGKVDIDTQYIFSLINKSLQICDGFIQDNWYKTKSEEFIRCQNCRTLFTHDIKKKSKCPQCGHKGYREIIDTEKDEAVIDLVEDIDPTKNKVVIWAVFRFSITKL